MAATAYLLWIGVGTAAFVDYHSDAHLAGVAAILMAIIAATMHIRIGQMKVWERVSIMVEADRLNMAVRQLPPQRPDAR